MVDSGSDEMREFARLVSENIKLSRTLRAHTKDWIEVNRRGRRMIVEAFEKYGWGGYVDFWKEVERNLGEGR